MFQAIWLADDTILSLPSVTGRSDSARWSVSDKDSQLNAIGIQDAPESDNGPLPRPDGTRRAVSWSGERQERAEGRETLRDTFLTRHEAPKRGWVQPVLRDASRSSQPHS